MKLKSEEQTKAKLRKSVDRIDDLSQVLSGKKPLGGKIGAKIQKAKDVESSLKNGKVARDKKFKAFDAYCHRLEDVANKHVDAKKGQRRKVEIKRTSIVNPKNPDKVI